ncbi:hypothetical protein RFI_37826 [Reticulomyxa filosa]|uniref:Uncharacterized protein n=1 Tax=Reticulomyxa filosa TaxID=46433 RepID=X6LFX7_RETFI|nr:hypothetical protein RFI_37826 [Reticulomyxa filosa]|eukprot:ETN99644.1 hypothetical protein RFI_37826 [Reticulomyxa filosa]
MKKKMFMRKKKGEVYVYHKKVSGEDVLCILWILFRKNFKNKKKKIKRVWIGNVVCDQLFRLQRQTRMQLPILSSKFVLHLAVQSKRPNSNLSKIQLHVQSILSKFACCNVKFFFFLLIFFYLRINKQTKKIRLCDYAKNDADWKHCPTSCNCWDKMCLQVCRFLSMVQTMPLVIEALLAQMRRLGDNASDEQVGRGAHPRLCKLAPYQQRCDLILHLASTQDCTMDGLALQNYLINTLLQLKSKYLHPTAQLFAGTMTLISITLTINQTSTISWIMPSYFCFVFFAVE